MLQRTQKSQSYKGADVGERSRHALAAAHLAQAAAVVVLGQLCRGAQQEQVSAANWRAPP